MRSMIERLALAAALGTVVHAAGPLDARVTVSFNAASGSDVLGILATGAGLRLQIAEGTLKPVTITLSNVRLSHALNAVCDTALCAWRVDGTTLLVTPLPSEGAASLPPTVTFEVRDASPADVFRALASAIGVRVSIDPALSNELVSMNFRNASTPTVLNVVCEVAHCTWDFDAQRGLTITVKK